MRAAPHPGGEDVCKPSVALAAAALLSISVGLVPGFLGFDAWALALMSLGTALAFAAARADGAAWLRPRFATRSLRGAAALVLALFCASHLVLAPGIYVDPPRPPEFRWLGAVATLLSGTYLLRTGLPTWLTRLRFGALVALFGAMAAVVVTRSPFPRIDVWWVQQYAGSLFARGDNPYTFLFPNIYGHAAVFGEGVATATHVTAFPYPPLTFMLGAPFVEGLHDVRFLMITLVAGAAIAVRLGARDELVELCCLAFLFQPRSFFVLEQAWTEPIVLAAATGAVVAIRRIPSTRRGWIAAAILGGLLVASKQYSPLVALPLLAVVPGGARARVALLAAVIPAATMLPYVAWNGGEFWRDVVAMQFAQPFRNDALSWLVPVSMVLGRPVSALWGFVALVTVLGLLWSRMKGTAGAMRVVAAAWLAFVIFNKQAFANYYWFATGLLLVSIGAESTSHIEAGSTRRT